MTVKLCEGTGEMMVVLTGATRQLPDAEEVIYTIDDAIAAACIKSGMMVDAEEEAEGPVPYYYLQSVIVEYKKGDLHEPAKEYVPAAGSRTVCDHVVFPGSGTERDYEISAPAFYQVNTPGMVRLYEQAARYAGLTGEEILLDLYCGAGTIGLSMADRAAYIVGIEEVRGAVLDANRNVVINGIVNARYYTGKAEEVLPQILTPGDPQYAEYLFAEGLRDKPFVAVLDPPRAGCEETLLRSVAGEGGWRGADRIVYISCDPGTLARDAAALTGLGYVLQEVTPVALFDHTGHVEAVSLWKRQDQ
ncbi:MAG: class I SAM-dependent RNA methyltransferase [Mogibacterium sp.]|nr:class I SAM-dependent RNA methyltransferase [Mogibacterium sp.]